MKLHQVESQLQSTQQVKAELEMKYKAVTKDLERISSQEQELRRNQMESEKMAALVKIDVKEVRQG